MHAITKVSHRRSEIAIVYLAGLVQGLGLVTFPATSTVFTSTRFYALTSDQYGAMFVPMVILAIFGSTLGGGVARRWGVKRLYLAGLCFNLLSMSTLVFSQLFMGQHAVAYGVLLAALAFLGAGFGTTVTALNTFAAGFFPGKTDAAVLAMNALLGTGTALAPVLAAVFLDFAAWWLLPVVVGASALVLIFLSVAQPLQIAVTTSGSGSNGAGALLRELPAVFWVYVLIVTLYGICETIFGNWATIYLHEDKGLSMQRASFALAAFWAMVTVGRVLAASGWVPVRAIYIGSPALILLALIGIPSVEGAVANVVSFGFAGLACAAFFPLSISFAQKACAPMVALVSGAMIAAYQVGYGLGAFGPGLLRAAGGIDLSTIYTAAGVLAFMLIALAWFVTNRQQTPI